MFTAIGLMLTGIALGFALRSFQWPELLGRAISPTIMLMLFALGVAVGGNETLMTNLPVLGGKALILTVACVAGSLIGARLLEPIMNRHVGRYAVSRTAKDEGAAQ